MWQGYLAGLRASALIPAIMHEGVAELLGGAGAQEAHQILLKQIAASPAPATEELGSRIQEHLTAYPENADVAIIWDGYLAALLEWGVIRVEQSVLPRSNGGFWQQLTFTRCLTNGLSWVASCH